MSSKSKTTASSARQIFQQLEKFDKTLTKLLSLRNKAIDKLTEGLKSGFITSTNTNPQGKTKTASKHIKKPFKARAKKSKWVEVKPITKTVK